MGEDRTNLTPPLREILRYMGCRQEDADERLIEKVKACLEKLKEVVTPRYICRKYEIRRDAGKVISGDRQAVPEPVEIAGMIIRSRDLAKNLSGCTSCYLMAATLGLGPDRLIKRSQAGRISECVIYQAAAAAMIEEYTDRLQEKLAREEKKEGRYLRPRFSPGYGDYPLQYQEDISRILQLPKTVGITLTDSLMMVPTKSVTALIGVSETDAGCLPQGCETCPKKECLYRR